MRLARSPLCSYEYSLRAMIDFFSIRRLYTSAGDYCGGGERSLCCLFDWGNSCFTPANRDRPSMLEIPFILPEGFVKAHEEIGWDMFSHATDLRNVPSILNTGVFIPSKEGEGGIKMVNGRRYEGIYAFKDSVLYDWRNHTAYSIGTEFAADGLWVSCSFKLLAPTKWVHNEGFESVPGTNGSRKQCACPDIHRVFRVALRLYFYDASLAHTNGITVYEQAALEEPFELYFSAIAGPAPYVATYWDPFYKVE